MSDIVVYLVTLLVVWCLLRPGRSRLGYRVELVASRGFYAVILTESGAEVGRTGYYRRAQDAAMEAETRVCF